MEELTSLESKVISNFVFEDPAQIPYSELEISTTLFSYFLRLPNTASEDRLSCFLTFKFKGYVHVYIDGMFVGSASGYGVDYTGFFKS